MTTSQRYPALFTSTTGHDDIATGYQALYRNTTGHDNLASGSQALINNTTGSFNVAAGSGVLFSNSTGNNNVANGNLALDSNTTGHDNAALGANALAANKTGSSNLALGSGAGNKLTTGSHNVEIANVGKAGESGTIRIGGANQTRAFIAGVSGKSISGPVKTVVINASGQLGTKSPSAKLKANPLSAKVSSLNRELRRQAGEIRRLQARVRGG